MLDGHPLVKRGSRAKHSSSIESLPTEISEYPIKKSQNKKAYSVVREAPHEGHKAAASP
jgi:hypothetical protein